MSSWLEIYGILWKQYFIKFRIWIVFLLLGAVLIGINRTAYKEEAYQGILVGVCFEDENGIQLFDKLMGEQGIFRFYGYSDEQDMIRQIENGTLECGYMLPKGFYDNLLKGKKTRQITLYCSPASSAHKISYEVVFAELFELLSQDILKEYLKDVRYVEEEDMQEAQEKLLALNEQYSVNGSTFHFVYETTENQVSSKPENLNVLRGITGVIIFFMSLLGLGNSLDHKNTWKAVQGNRGKRLQSGSIHVAVCGSSILGGLCLMLARAGENPVREAASLLLYFFILEIYIRGLSLFIKSSKVLYGLLPVMMLGCCLFCPVFIRIDRYLPAVKWISGVFPVTYYLML